MIPLPAAGIAALVIAAGAFTAGWRTSADHRDAQILRDERNVAKGAAAATEAAVTAIKAIDIKRVTIRQELEREIRYAPAVGTECDVSDGVFSALNKGLAGPGAGGNSVPGPDTAAGQEPR